MTEQLNQEQQQTIDKLRQFLKDSKLEMVLEQPTGEHIEKWRKRYSTSLVVLLEKALILSKISPPLKQKLEEEVIQVFGPFDLEAVQAVVEDFRVRRVLESTKLKELRGHWDGMR